MIQTLIEIEPDDTRDIPLQSPLIASGLPATYTVSDVLSAELWQPGMATATATNLPVAWFTAPDPATGQPTQNGYDQGQTVTTLLLSLVSTLQPGSTYILKVFRVMASNTARRERIATARIKVRPLAAV